MRSAQTHPNLVAPVIESRIFDHLLQYPTYARGALRIGFATVTPRTARYSACTAPRLLGRRARRPELGCGRWFLAANGGPSFGSSTAEVQLTGVPGGELLLAGSKDTDHISLDVAV